MPTQNASPFTVEKSTVELYKIRHKSGCYWADITIDAHERGGRICIASDFGNWQNYWGAAGPDFKTFLGEISKDYAATKFGVEEWLDVEGSVKLWKELLLGRRRDEAIDADEARAVYEEIEGLANEDHRSLAVAFANTSFLSPFICRACGMPEFAYKPDPRFTRFWKELWPVLLAEFAREKEAVPA